MHVTIKNGGCEPSESIGKAMAEYPDLAVDLVRLLRAGQPVAKNPMLENKCKFHIREAGKECPYKGDIL